MMIRMKNNAMSWSHFDRLKFVVIHVPDTSLKFGLSTPISVTPYSRISSTLIGDPVVGTKSMLDVDFTTTV
jgi:hypothetical protein